MGLNELLLFATVLLCTGLVFGAWKLDRERLYGVIVLFLILISVGGGKIAEFFGYTTNTGNIFYGAVFLATYFLIERYGGREGVRSIGVGVAGVAFFVLMISLTSILIGVENGSVPSTALSATASILPRIAFASLLAYALSQTLNVLLFIYLKRRMQGRRLWLRANLSNAAAQLLDSAVFFTIAFWGIASPENIWEILITGFVMKVVYMMLVSPLLYTNTIEREEGADYVAITLR